MSRGPIALAMLLVLVPASGSAQDLHEPGSWAALASDRNAHRAGDIITILVYENASASNSAVSSSDKAARLSGSVNAGRTTRSAGGAVEGSSDSSGSTGRSGRMVAQISGTVVGIEPNGDLDIVAQQLIHINREKTLIKVRGRARPSDIGVGNTILSSRLAYAAIDYDGTGFVSRSARQGVIARIFSWFGLL